MEGSGESHAMYFYGKKGKIVKAIGKDRKKHMDDNELGGNH